MVGRKKACRAETVVHLFKICGARQYVVASVKRIKTETIANAELYPGARHELHQAHRTTRRNRVLVTSTFNLENGANPRGRQGEAIRGLLDEFGANRSVDTRRDAVCAHALDSKSAAVAIMHMNGATATLMRAMGWSDRCRAIASVNSRV